MAESNLTLPRKQYRCTIPADRTAYRDDIVLETRAFDEFEMRHLIRCAFGTLASQEAEIHEVRP